MSNEKHRHNSWRKIDLEIAFGLGLQSNLLLVRIQVMIDHTRQIVFSGRVASFVAPWDAGKRPRGERGRFSAADTIADITKFGYQVAQGPGGYSVSRKGKVLQDNLNPHQLADLLGQLQEDEQN